MPPLNPAGIAHQREIGLSPCKLSSERMPKIATNTDRVMSMGCIGRLVNKCAEQDADDAERNQGAHFTPIDLAQVNAAQEYGCREIQQQH